MRLTFIIACFRGYDEEEDWDSNDRFETVKILVEFGSNVNYVKSVTGITPLHWAAYNDDTNTVTFLLDNDAHITFNN